MKKIKTYKLIIWVLILLLSILNYESDAIKFFFSGYSATYEIEMIRHHYILNLFLTVLLIGLSIYNSFSKKRWKLYMTVFILIIWVYTMQTYAINQSQNEVIRGWSVIKFDRCNYSNNLDSVFILDPYLKKKMEQKIKNN